MPQKVPAHVPVVAEPALHVLGDHVHVLKAPLQALVLIDEAAEVCKGGGKEVQDEIAGFRADIEHAKQTAEMLKLRHQGKATDMDLLMELLGQDDNG